MSLFFSAHFFIDYLTLPRLNCFLVIYLKSSLYDHLQIITNYLFFLFINSSYFSLSFIFFLMSFMVQSTTPFTTPFDTPEQKVKAHKTLYIVLRAPPTQNKTALNEKCYFHLIIANSLFSPIFTTLHHNSLCPGFLNYQFFHLYISIRIFTSTSVLFRILSTVHLL